jgi:hypothetical protein
VIRSTVRRDALPYTPNRPRPDDMNPGSSVTAPTPQPGPQPGPSSAAAPSPAAAAAARLEGVHELPLHEQPDVYQTVHTELQNALAAIDHA